MVFEQRHEMQLKAVYPSGAEEWLCPECGRRFIAQWEPKFRRVILEHGDEVTIHTGQGIDLQAQISVESSDHKVPDKTELNDAWKQLLNKLDIDLEEDDDLDQ